MQINRKLCAGKSKLGDGVNTDSGCRWQSTGIIDEFRVTGEI
jgi:hypothetical protein